MYFDLESRYLATYGKDTVNIITLLDKSKYIESVIIKDKRQYSIIDIQLVSNSDKSYRCDLACHQKGTKNIYIYQLGQEIDPKRCVTIQDSRDIDLCLGAIVKISKDFKSLVLSYEKENYVLTHDATYGYKQQYIPQLLGKKVNKIY